MAFFPTDWEVHDISDFTIFQEVGMQDAPLGMNTSMKVGPDGRSFGVYKITLFGGGNLGARYDLSEILYEPPLPSSPTST